MAERNEESRQSATQASSITDFQPFKRILKNLLRQNSCLPFVTPVDWQNFELFDYPSIVKEPMDLGTVRDKLSEGHYNNVKAAADDVRLVWSNCILYNTEGSELSLVAQTLSAKFDALYNEAYSAYEVDVRKVDPDALVSVPERARLARLMLKLSRKQHAALVEYMEKNFPNAVHHCPMEHDVLLNLDAMSRDGFQEVSAFVQDQIASRKRKLGG